MKKKFNIIILSAGTNSRMGFQKALLSMSSDISFVGSVVNQAITDGASTICLVCNNDNLFAIKKITPAEKIQYAIQPNPDNGRFSSVTIGITATGNAFPVFIHNVDCPVIPEGLMKKMLLCLKPFSYVVPVYKEKGGHPILISPEILKEWPYQVNGKQRLDEFLKGYTRINYTCSSPEILLNINTPEEYQHFIGNPESYIKSTGEKN